MEEKISLLGQIKQTFDCRETDVRSYSPLTLAYIGDAVYDLIIRSVIVERANRKPNELHKRTVMYVSAEAQAKILDGMKGELTEEEEAVFKRGRNAKPHSTAKNAAFGDYRKATGLEALIGFLYLDGRLDRVIELINKGIDIAGMSI